MTSAQSNTELRPCEVPGAEHAPPRPSRFYRPELDALRFFAFLSVFLHHCTNPNGAFVVRTLRQTFGFGLCLFFFLSSYLITELLQREKEKTGTVHLASFYIRRILRIWPLYFFFLAFIYFYGKLVPSESMPAQLLLCFFFLSANWWVVAHRFLQIAVMPLWSISVEEQFYVTWPVLNKVLGPKPMSALSIAIVALSSLTAYWMTSHGADPVGSVWASTFVQFQYFALGSLLSSSLRGKTINLSAGIRVAGLAAALGIWLAAAVLVPSQAAIAYLLAGGGCALIVVCVTGIQASAIPGPLVYLGKISYGLYVFHALCLSWSMWLITRFPVPRYYFVEATLLKALALAVCVALASVSYKVLESPFLRLKERFSFVLSRAT
jgi:peptidoglycan/LPS O-acetylase OafA/YrhL